MTTSAPSSANFLAICFPMPLDPPVTITTSSFISLTSTLLFNRFVVMLTYIASKQHGSGAANCSVIVTFVWLTGANRFVILSVRERVELVLSPLAYCHRRPDRVEFL